MNVYHASPSRNRVSITKSGLLRSKSQQKRDAVWVHLKGAHLRAICHVARYKRVRADEVDVWCVTCKKKDLRHHRDGWYYLEGDVPASSVRLVTGRYVLGGF